MKAVQFSEHGDRDVIEYDEFPDPEVGPEDVLVDVKAGALNHLDVWTRKGLGATGRLDLEMPHIPGSDMAGVVASVGDDVTRFEPGDHESARRFRQDAALRMNRAMSASPLGRNRTTGL